MVIKLIIFDLDGVLVESRDAHYVALNKALADFGILPITYQDHLDEFNGKPTRTKLRMLEARGLVPTGYIESIWAAKQKYTSMMVPHMMPHLRKLLQTLYDHGYKLACCSNSIGATVKNILVQTDTMQYFHTVLSCEDVAEAKPSPLIYQKCMNMHGADSCETVIVEDSPIGVAAAIASGARVMRVADPSQVTYNLLYHYLYKLYYTTEALNVVIPMAGLGSRFTKAGYVDPKPFIKIQGRPMIQWVVDNLSIVGPNVQYTFIVRKAHIDRYNAEQILNEIVPGCNIIPVQHITEGAACTVLLAEDIINVDNGLLIANSDQYVEFSPSEFMAPNENNILVFRETSQDPKWSYAKVNEAGQVTEVAEKKCISEFATTGIYYWKRGSDFVRCAKQMIAKNCRTNGEFYICPVYNEAIAASLPVLATTCRKMWGLGTPLDLDHFLLKHNLQTSLAT